MSSAKCSCLILLMVCSTGPWSSAAFAGTSQQQEKPASAVFKSMDANGDISALAARLPVILS